MKKWILRFLYAVAVVTSGVFLALAAASLMLARFMDALLGGLR